MNKFADKIYGFTLAEVLITLLIIGVVSSIVIPSVIQDSQEAEYKAAYKKAFAVATQAWNSALSNGELSYTDGGSFLTFYKNYNVFKNYFDIIRDCPIGADISNCWANGEYFGPHPYSTSPGFIDSSGMSWSIAQGTYNYIIVDTNGFKSPNKYGRDRFILLCKTLDGQADGIPVKLGVYRDFPSINSVWCPSGSCYYESWLKQ